MCTKICLCNTLTQFAQTDIAGFFFLRLDKRVLLQTTKTQRKFFIRLCNVSSEKEIQYLFWKAETPKYEGHPINRENFLIMQEFVPFKHRKCNH